jgi:hypothetical protein
MQTADIFAGRLEVCPSTSAKGRQSTARQLTGNAKAETTPEHRLWKVCRQTVSPKLSKVDLLAFVFFAIVAVVAIVCSFSILFQTLGSGALEETVRTLITR